MIRTARAVIPSTRYRRALARVAVSAVDAGWPVVPGAWWSVTAGQFVCDVTGCTRSGPHPAIPSLPETPLDPEGGTAGSPRGLVVDALVSRAEVVDHWRRQAYGVLIPTGVACDAVEVPAALGRWLCAALETQGRLGPVLEAGNHWTLFTTPVVPIEPVDPDVSGLLPGVLQHGLGSWVALPPSRRPGGEASSWIRHPQASSWALPDHHEVTRLLRHAGGPRQVLVPAPAGFARRHRSGASGDDLVAMMS